MRFHGRAGTFTVDAPGEVVAIVPAHATTGRIRLTTPAGTTRSSRPFTVVNPATIKVTPADPLPGKRLNVSGRGFGAFEPVQVRLDHVTVASGDTDSTGRIRVAFTLSAAILLGNHTLDLTGLVSSAVATAIFTIFEPWPQFHFDAAKGGYQLYENVLSTSNVSSLTTAWTAPTGGAINSSPAVASGAVYVGSNDGKLYSFDAATGAFRWSYQTGARIFSSPAVGTGGIVYVGSADGSVYALRTSNGSVLWSRTTGGIVDSSPAVSGGVVYINSEDGVLRALSASTGTPLWSADCSCANEAPAVSNGVVYAWRFHPPGGPDHPNSVSAFNAATGALLWDQEPWNAEPPKTNGCCGIFTHGLSVVNGRIYVGTASGFTCAMNAADGSEAWCRATGHVLFYGVTGVPSVAQGVVRVGTTDGTIRAFNSASGSVLWSLFTTTDIVSSPAVANGVLYVGAGDGKLYVLNAATGGLLTTKATGGAIVSSPAVSEGRIYVGSGDGKLYAFGLP
ncbi:MAG TPA: PQQ-binding-like beta-propeller repeat protein [Gaiellaceae bacterium]|nr:PQQ-binding-like beta-propeller repeat protein [Gaiellaceae bacterium]